MAEWHHELTKTIKLLLGPTNTELEEADRQIKQWLEEKADRLMISDADRVEILGLASPGVEAKKEECECDKPACCPDCICSNCHKWFNPARIQPVTRPKEAEPRELWEVFRNVYTAWPIDETTGGLENSGEKHCKALAQAAREFYRERVKVEMDELFGKGAETTSGILERVFGEEGK